MIIKLNSPEAIALTKIERFARLKPCPIDFYRPILLCVGRCVYERTNLQRLGGKIQVR